MVVLHAAAPTEEAAVRRVVIAEEHTAPGHQEVLRIPDPVRLQTGIPDIEVPVGQAVREARVIVEVRVIVVQEAVRPGVLVTEAQVEDPEAQVVATEVPGDHSDPQVAEDPVVEVDPAADAEDNKSIIYIL